MSPGYCSRPGRNWRQCSAGGGGQCSAGGRGDKQGTLWEMRKHRISTTISETGRALYLANIWSAFLENEWGSVWSQVRRRSRHLRQKILVELLEVKRCLPQPTPIFFPQIGEKSSFWKARHIIIICTSHQPPNVINYLWNRPESFLKYSHNPITPICFNQLVQVDRIRHFLDKQRVS